MSQELSGSPIRKLCIRSLYLSAYRWTTKSLRKYADKVWKAKEARVGSHFRRLLTVIADWEKEQAEAIKGVKVSAWF
jgi:hypothetical protein